MSEKKGPYITYIQALEDMYDGAMTGVKTHGDLLERFSYNNRFGSSVNFDSLTFDLGNGSTY